MALGDIITRLAVSLELETAGFEKGATLAEKRFQQTKRKFETIGKSMADVGTKLSIGLTAPLAALGVASFRAAQESADALGQVTATLKSMGDASGRTVEQLQALAETQMGQSLFDDDEILRKVTANLLTFGNVSGAAFDGAQQAALNLSARLGTDLQASAIRVGKALNDPIKGVTALQRVGVSFTAAQKEQIAAMVEAGNVAGAQSLILAELEKQFGGAAQAARDASPTADATQAWNDFQETIGKLVIEVLPPLTEFLAKVLNRFNELSPGMQKVIVAGAAIAAVLGPVLVVLGGVVSIGGPLVALLVKLAPAFALLGKSLLLLALNPAFLTFAAVVTGIYLAFKFWPEISAIVQRMVTAVRGFLVDKLGAVWQTVLGKIEAVKRGFFDLYDAVVGNSYIPDMVDGIAAEMARLDTAMVNPAAQATKKTGDAFRELAGEVQGILDRLFPQIAAARRYAAEAGVLSAGIADPTARRTALRALGNEEAGLSRQGLSFDLEEAAKPLAGMSEGVERLIERLADLPARAKETTVRVAKTFKDMATETLGALSRLSDAIKGGGFLSILEGIVGLGIQLGSIGAFGKKIQTNINTAVPGYASGGYPSRGLALVGERGPELVSFRGGERVFSNADSRGMMGSRVQIVPSPYFDVVVDGRVQRAAPGIAGAGAQLAGQQQMFQRSRRLA